MAKQYDKTILEVDVKKLLEATRDELQISSLSATITYLVDQLPQATKKAVTRRLNDH